MTRPDAVVTDRLRSICLALPEAVEKVTWDAPTFRVRDRIFAMLHAADDRASVWCKAPPGAQAVLVGAAPERFFRPPYVGPKGWIGVWLDTAAGWQEADWQELADLISRSYRMTAPKRLLSSPADTSVEPSRRKSPPSRRARRRTPAASAH